MLLNLDFRSHPQTTGVEPKKLHLVSYYSVDKDVGDLQTILSESLKGMCSAENNIYMLHHKLVSLSDSAYVE